MKKKIILILGPDLKNTYDNIKRNFFSKSEEYPLFSIYGNGVNLLPISLLEEISKEIDSNTQIHLLGHGSVNKTDKEIVIFDLPSFREKDIFIKISEIINFPINIHIHSCYALNSICSPTPSVDYLPNNSIVLTHTDADILTEYIFLSSIISYLQFSIVTDRDYDEIILDSVLKTLGKGAFFQKISKISTEELTDDDKDSKISDWNHYRGEKPNVFCIGSLPFILDIFDRKEELREYIYQNIYLKIYEYLREINPSILVKDKFEILTDDYLERILINYIKYEENIDPRINIPDYIMEKLKKSEFSEAFPENQKLLLQKGFLPDFKYILSLTCDITKFMMVAKNLTPENKAKLPQYFENYNIYLSSTLSDPELDNQIVNIIIFDLGAKIDINNLLYIKNFETVKNVLSSEKFYIKEEDGGYWFYKLLKNTTFTKEQITELSIIIFEQIPGIKIEIPSRILEWDFYELLHYMITNDKCEPFKLEHISMLISMSESKKDSEKFEKLKNLFLLRLNDFYEITPEFILIIIEKLGFKFLQNILSRSEVIFNGNSIFYMFEIFAKLSEEEMGNITELILRNLKDNTIIYASEDNIEVVEFFVEHIPNFSKMLNYMKFYKSDRSPYQSNPEHKIKLINSYEFHSEEQSETQEDLLGKESEIKEL